MKRTRLDDPNSWQATMNTLAKAVIQGTLLLSILLTMSAWAEIPVRQALILDDGQQQHELHVEIARTAAQRARGLMERDALPAEAGMLFVYDSEQSGSNAYWMYKTRIPLDIAFIDSQGVIRSLRTMSPCRSTSSRECPVYPAGAPFRAALETNAGYFAAHDIAVGDRIELAPWLEAP